MTTLIRSVILTIAICTLAYPAYPAGGPQPSAGSPHPSKGWKAAALSGGAAGFVAGFVGDTNTESNVRQKAIAGCESHRENKAIPCVATVTKYPNFLLVMQCESKKGNQTTRKAYVSKPNADYKVVVADVFAQVKKDGFDPKNCRGQLF
jgi:hypothetical protein